MKKSVFLIAMTFMLSFVTEAQVDKKYLAGAVPEVDGKVVFSKTFNIPGKQKSEVYQIALAWANANYKEEDSRVVYTDAEKGVLSCKGSNDLIFQSTALSLDKAEINYQLNIFCENASCRAEVKAISYAYMVSNKEQPEIYKAETWITDKEAVNKDKLYRSNGKFRMKTIDLVDLVFASISGSLTSGNQQVMTPDTGKRSTETESPFVVATVAPVPTANVVAADVSTVVESATPAALSGTSTLKSHKKIEADKIPGNIIKMLTNDWMLITAGNDTKFNMMTASWGGLGVLWEMPVAYCFIHPSRYTFDLMDKGTYYTLSFYTEAYRDILQYCGSNSGRDTDKVKGSGLTPITMPSGSKAFEEAWLILECRKVLGQQITSESVADSKTKKEQGDRPFNKLFAGEIIGVWVK